MIQIEKNTFTNPEKVIKKWNATEEFIAKKQNKFTPLLKIKKDNTSKASSSKKLPMGKSKKTIAYRGFAY